MEKLGQEILESGSWHGKSLKKAKMSQRNFYFVSNREHSGGGAFLLMPEALETLEQKLGGPYLIAFTVLDGLVVVRDDDTGCFPAVFRSLLKVQKYWPSGFVDHLYRFDSRHGLTIPEDCAR